LWGWWHFFISRPFRQKGVVRGFVKKFTSKELSEGNTAIIIENDILKFFKEKRHFLKVYLYQFCVLV